jgi:D-alanyl-D-alanine carboxypeptidase
MDARTGRYICGYNEDVQTQPASLTKMMTLLLTFKALKNRRISLNSKIKISKKAANQRPCKLGLKPGEKITVRNAILALVTKSANDVAVALGEHIAGNENTFVYLMNKEARRLNMKSTVFVNPSGWKNPKQLSTARDMAKLARALIRGYPKYYHFFATKKFSYKRAKMRNHNKLLGTRKGVVIDGIKTGYVAASGYNLAASAKKGRRRLIAVVLGGETAKQRDEEVNRLLKKGFNVKKGKSMSEIIALKNKKISRKV